MKASLKIEVRELNDAFRVWNANSRRTSAQNLEIQGGLLARDLILVTPPNDGKLNRRQGEAAVRGDLSRAVKPAPKPRYSKRGALISVTGAGVDLPIARVVHERKRNRKGRVPRGSKPEFAQHVPEERRRSVGNVGKLAAGWVASMRRFGKSIPAWIARHGASRGDVAVRLTWPRMFVMLSNRVPFVNNVHELDRRLWFALRKRADALTRQNEHFLKNSARRAGFR